MVVYLRQWKKEEKMKKITAIVLSVVMVVCLFTVYGYAQTEKPFYLVLGDSIAYGSGISNSKEACYGKIVADGDRQLDPQTVMIRCLQFGLKNYPELDKSDHYERFRAHLLEKYARNGYLKLWIPTGDKAQQLNLLHEIIDDEEKLQRCFEEIWENAK